jgi:hypothetical protein
VLGLVSVLSKPRRKRFAVAANFPTPRPSVSAARSRAYDQRVSVTSDMAFGHRKSWSCIPSTKFRRGHRQSPARSLSGRPGSVPTPTPCGAPGVPRRCAAKGRPRLRDGVLFESSAGRGRQAASGERMGGAAAKGNQLRQAAPAIGLPCQPAARLCRGCLSPIPPVWWPRPASERRQVARFGDAGVRGAGRGGFGLRHASEAATRLGPRGAC